MKMIFSTVQSLSREQYRVCLALAIRPYSLLRDNAVLSRRKQIEDIPVLLLIDDNDVIVGWSAVFRGLSGKFTIMLNVRRSERRKGYGTVLLNNMKAFCDSKGYQWTVCPWDPKSREFFRQSEIKGSQIEPGFCMRE